MERLHEIEIAKNLLYSGQLKKKKKKLRLWQIILSYLGG